MKVLIVGGSGFLGAELVRQSVAAGWQTAATYHSRPGTLAGASWHRLDLRAPGSVDELLAALGPRAVVNATSGQSDWAVTADGSVRVAMAAAKAGCRLVHVSSDAVFSGSRARYDESCPPDPITPYGARVCPVDLLGPATPGTAPRRVVGLARVHPVRGRSSALRGTAPDPAGSSSKTHRTDPKSAAETAVRLLVPSAAVARTSLIVGDGGSGHERRVHALVQDPRAGVLFTDDIRCPVHVADLAGALRELAVGEQAGMCHLGGADAVSRHGLGVLVARRDGLDATRLPAGRRADSPLPGALDVRLDSSATQRRVRTRLRGAREFLGAARTGEFGRSGRARPGTFSA